MKFKYYIVDTAIASVFGTNDDKIAEECRPSDELIVINSETGTWLDIESEEDIEESPAYKEAP